MSEMKRRGMISDAEFAGAARHAEIIGRGGGRDAGSAIEGDLVEEEEAYSRTAWRMSPGARETEAAGGFGIGSAWPWTFSSTSLPHCAELDMAVACIAKYLSLTTSR